MEELPAVIPLLLQMLEIPSPTGQEQKICDWVERTVRGAAERGRPLTWDRIGDALVVHGPRETGRLHLVLLGHLDTVPAPDSLKPRLEKDRVIGRGAVDMKAGLAVMMGLIEGLDLERAQVDLTWVFYPREEGPYELNGLADLLRGRHFPLDADLYILLEPTHGQLQLGCLGSVSADATFLGVAAHAARPWLGSNAITKAGRWLLNMDRRKPRAVVVRDLTYRVHQGRILIDQAARQRADLHRQTAITRRLDKGVGIRLSKVVVRDALTGVQRVGTDRIVIPGVGHVLGDLVEIHRLGRIQGTALDDASGY